MPFDQKIFIGMLRQRGRVVEKIGEDADSVLSLLEARQHGAINHDEVIAELLGITLRSLLINMIYVQGDQCYSDLNKLLMKLGQAERKHEDDGAWKSFGDLFNC